MSRSNFKSSDLSSLLSSEAGTDLQHTRDDTELTFKEGDDGVTVRGRERKVVKRWRRGEGVEESDSDDDAEEEKRAEDGGGKLRSGEAPIVSEQTQAQTRWDRGSGDKEDGGEGAGRGREQAGGGGAAQGGRKRPGSSSSS